MGKDADCAEYAFLVLPSTGLCLSHLSTSQRHRDILNLVKRTASLLNKEGPSRRAVLKKGTDPFQEVLGNVSASLVITMMRELLAFSCPAARMLRV